MRSHSIPKRFQGAYPLQVLAHLYFILSGLWLSFRWTINRFKGWNPNLLDERRALANRFKTYLDLLRMWGIVRVATEGFDDAPSWEGAVIVSNHPSILDAVLLMNLLPGLDCVINAELLKSPVMSGAANLCGFILNDGLLSMAKNCRKRLDVGSNILIFPEGTRTMVPPANPFHRIYALIACSAGVPVRTVLIEADSDYFGRAFSHFRPAHCPMNFRIRTGQIFYPEKEEDPRCFSDRIETYFRSSLDSSVTFTGEVSA